MLDLATPTIVMEANGVRANNDVLKHQNRNGVSFYRKA